MHGLTVDLHLIAQQARQDIERLESARTFVAYLEKVEIEQSSRRGLVTLRLPSGESEHIRTEHAGTDRGGALIERAHSLQGRWVLVYRYNERKAGQQNQSVRIGSLSPDGRRSVSSPRRLDSSISTFSRNAMKVRADSSRSMSCLACWAIR